MNEKEFVESLDRLFEWGKGNTKRLNISPVLARMIRLGFVIESPERNFRLVEKEPGLFDWQAIEPSEKP